MMNRLVTVFGGGGFVGRYVTQALLAKGVRVRIAQRDPRQAWFLKPLGGLGQTQFVAADITRPDTVARAVAGSDGVVNLVGVLEGDFRRFHVEGARNVARAVADAGAGAFVQVSAIGADPDSPSAYGRSKGEGERAVREAFADTIIVRPSIVFGREDQFINRFAGMIRKTPVVPVIKADAKFQPVFVADVADAIAAALSDPDTFKGHIFELGGPDVITMGALQRWIAETIGRDPKFIELPDAVGATIARAGFLPGAPISWDQWQMLQRDNVVARDAAGIEAFEVTPTPMAAVAPEWMVRFRRQGRFSRRVDQTI